MKQAQISLKEKHKDLLEKLAELNHPQYLYEEYVDISDTLELLESLKDYDEDQDSRIYTFTPRALEVYSVNLIRFIRDKVNDRSK